MKPKAIGLVVVLRGFADVYEPRHVDVRVVDIDNIKAGDGPALLPKGIGFEELVADAGIEDYVKFVKTEVTP